MITRYSTIMTSLELLAIVYSISPDKKLYSLIQKKKKPDIQKKRTFCTLDRFFSCLDSLCSGRSPSIDQTTIKFLYSKEILKLVSNKGIAFR